MATLDVSPFLPVLAGVAERGFNIFDVMHHGRHEKQISNVFAWLLDADGTHGLGKKFQAIFIDRINKRLPSEVTIGVDGYSVRQEVNTAPEGAVADIADLVLEDDDTIIVVENYHVSDGHGHSYHGYRDFGVRQGKRTEVVMLCQTVQNAYLTEGWEAAAVVQYTDLLDPLIDLIERDKPHRTTFPDQVLFLRHMRQAFTTGERMNTADRIGFMVAMCSAGKGETYRASNRDDAIRAFADQLRERTIEQFHGSIDLLREVKAALRAHVDNVVVPQVHAAGVPERITVVSASYQGIFQWSINFWLAEETEEEGEASVQLLFGPSAWFAKERDSWWRRTVPAEEADYSRVFVGARRQLFLTDVSIAEVIDGLDTTDRRLGDAIVAALRTTRDSTAL